MAVYGCEWPWVAASGCEWPWCGCEWLVLASHLLFLAGIRSERLRRSIRLERPGLAGRPEGGKEFVRAARVTTHCMQLCSRGSWAWHRDRGSVASAALWRARACCRSCRARSASGMAAARARASRMSRMACACSVLCRGIVGGAEDCVVQAHGSMLCIVGAGAPCGRRRARPQRRRRADGGRRGARGGRARPGRGAWAGRWAPYLRLEETLCRVFRQSSERSHADRSRATVPDPADDTLSMHRRARVTEGTPDGRRRGEGEIGESPHFAAVIPG